MEVGVGAYAITLLVTSPISNFTDWKEYRFLSVQCIEGNMWGNYPRIRKYVIDHEHVQ